MTHLPARAQAVAAARPEGTPPSDALPARAVGVGLKPAHMADLRADPGPVSWVEVHAENAMQAGGPRRHALEAVRRDHPLSIHGVGLSLGGAEGLDRAHLARLRRVVDRYQPALVSEHLAWCASGGTFLNDLLPLPYTDEALDLVTRHVDQTQEALGRPILVENPSRYLAFDPGRPGDDREEPEFLTALVRRTGCGLLLDVNNIVVSAGNLGFDPLAYLDGAPLDAVGEIHVAGHAVRRIDGVDIRIDDHGSPAPEAVLALYVETLRRTGPRPTLLERDTNVPPWAALAAEAGRLDDLLQAAADHPQPMPTPETRR
ncbi:DUF692 domain-containing protein [Roseospira visakhapatnamensis]|uniref:UPF0276 protein GGD89_002100 n=1 Tax=Roseospira visakhapatnamensis TaxID=390880 RepID=A0A7W6RDG3_9PROT|nr:DUF692 domain-containing protein [Roseospira visakhapatnamensis]MBB4266468.1 hypothetical protein [Roseospira visakhapatnamensis]